MNNSPNVTEEYPPLSIFEYVHNSIKTLRFALSELLVFNQIRDKNAKHFVNSQIMKNYHFTLMYTFVLEYCKLTEKDEKTNNPNNYSGLKKLNHIVFEKKGKEYESTFSEIEESIKAILDSPLCKKIRALRDKKIAHIDKNNKYGFTFDMYYFAEEEVHEIIEHFNSFLGILNACAQPYEAKNRIQTNHPLYEILSKSVAYFDSLDNTKTLQEIEEYAKYEEFYNQNYKE